MYENWEQALIDKIGIYQVISRVCAAFAGAIFLLLAILYFAGMKESFGICMQDYQNGRRKRRLSLLAAIFFCIVISVGVYADEGSGEAEDPDTIVEDSEGPLVYVDYQGFAAGITDGKWLNDINSPVQPDEGVEPGRDGISFFGKNHQIIIRVREPHLSSEDLMISVYSCEDGRSLTEAMPEDYDLEEWTESNGTYMCRIMFEKEGRYRLTIKGQDQYGNLMQAGPDFMGEVEDGCYTSPILVMDWTAPQIESFLLDGKAEKKAVSDRSVRILIRVKEKNFHGSCLTLSDEICFRGQRQSVMTEEDYGLVWHQAGVREKTPVYEAEFEIKTQALHHLRFFLADPGRDPVLVEEGTVIYDRTPPEMKYSAVDPEAGDVTFHLTKRVDAGMPYIRDYSDYRYFSAGKIFVRINIRDEISGIKNLSYCFFREGEAQEMKFLAPAADSYDWAVWLALPKEDYKGFLKAFARDSCGNKSDTVVSRGLVTEGEALHEAVSSIEIDGSNLPRPKQGVRYCRSDILIRADFRDGHSGLKEIKLGIRNKKDGRILYEKNKSFGQDKENPGKLTKEAGLTVKIPLSGLPASDRAHPFIIYAILEDNAGHRTERIMKQPVVADHEGPVVSVKYDNNEAKNKHFYKKERKAVIRVRDPGFAPDQTRWMISGPDRGYRIGSWEKDGYNYTCEVRFAEDGRGYRLAFVLTDNAGNETRYKDRDSFTIDTRSPILKVEIPGAKAENEYYYPETKILTFRIREDNQDKDKTRIRLGFMGKDSKGWKRNVRKYIRIEEIGKGVYRAVCDRDGTYNLEFSSQDLAGNTSSYTGRHKFVIDSEEPGLISSSVKDGKTFAGIFNPSLVFEDDNFDRDSMKAVIRRIDGIQNDQSVFEPDQMDFQGRKFTCSWGSFGEGNAGDGVYRLTVTGKDLAGNPVRRGNDILFRINRDGTIFSCDRKYCNKNHPVYLTQEEEINIRGLSVSKSLSEVIIIKNRDERSVLSGKQFSQEKSWNYAKKGKYYLWQLTDWKIPGSVFAKEGDYRVIVRTKEYDQTDSQGSALLETDNEIRGVPIRFIVDKSPPVVYLNGLDEPIFQGEQGEFRLTAMDNFRLKKVKVTIRAGLTGRRKKTILLKPKDFDDRHSVALSLIPGEKIQKVSYEAWDKAGNRLSSEQSGGSRTCIVLPKEEKESGQKKTAEPSAEVKKGKIPVYTIMFIPLSLLPLLVVRIGRKRKTMEDQENVD